MNALWSFIIIVSYIFEGVQKGISAAYDEYGGAPVLCACATILFAFFSAIEHEKVHWAVVLYPAGIYAVWSLARSVAERFRRDSGD